MLFNSYEFVLGFLPIVLVLVLGATWLGRHELAKLLLFLASLGFYAWWNPHYLVLLLALLAFNFAVGSWLIRTAGKDERRRTLVLVAGLLANIATLIYFKYTNFFARELGALLGVDLDIAAIVLPLGISFIVFQKIAFLVDAYGGQIKQLSFLNYGLFVSFFPQLISGPIVHHREVIPQLESSASLRYQPRVVPIALTFLTFGAFKKVIIADSLSQQVGVLFHVAGAGHALGAVDSWLGALAFTLQIYFDFSGYSDMAIGLGLLFGIRLPFNFNSPLKATSVIDFWRRWHITLTRFVTAYIYNPILLRAQRRRAAAGKRMPKKGAMPLDAFASLLVVPTLFTMFVVGFWHGAGWQFIAFGLIHGVYLCINHAWRTYRRSDGPRTTTGVLAARALTLVAVLVSIPFFRADNVHTAIGYLADMFGTHGLRPASLLHDLQFCAILAAVLFASQVLPNTQEVLRDQIDAATSPLAKHAGHIEPTDNLAWSWPRLAWRPTVWLGLGLGAVAWLVLLMMAAPSEFLYFQF